MIKKPKVGMKIKTTKEYAKTYPIGRHFKGIIKEVTSVYSADKLHYLVTVDQGRKRYFTLNAYWLTLDKGK